MKQYFIIFIASIALLTNCNHNRGSGELEGEIKGWEKDSILLFANDEFAYFLKQVAVEDGKFLFEMPMDTTMYQIMLYISDDEQYPIYLERGKTIHIKGDVLRPGRYDVKGNSVNEALTDFLQTLPEQASPSDTLTQRLVEEYIRDNQRSLINLYLLSKYFVDVPNPDFQKIKTLIATMHGTLQDKQYISELSKFIEQTENTLVDKIAPTFTLTSADGKRISRSDYREKYLLLNFWATWSDSSRVSNKELKALYKAFPPKKEDKNKTKKPNITPDPELAILSISVDMDKTLWKNAIKEDTLKWEQVCDFLGWNSPVVKQYAISHVPYNVLIDNKGKIIARGIGGEELRRELDSLFISKK